MTDSDGRQHESSQQIFISSIHRHSCCQRNPVPTTKMSDGLNPPINPKWATPLKEGDTIPSVTFKTRTRVDPATAENPENPFDWKDVTSEDYFKGKRVVLFGLPGAFTPLCSSQMVPGYDKARPELLELGIDEVYCISVNDAFVMRQWGLAQG